MAKHVLVGMSGGVDSSMTVLLLKEQGYRVSGATLRLCAQPGVVGENILQAEHDAADVAARLEISHTVWDYSELFQNTVVSDFTEAYRNGATPNPCIVCNRCIKFGKMLDQALEEGYDLIATGHYVRSEWDEARGRWLLKKAADSARDQSYVLYMLTQHQLAHTLFPLGDHTKPELRRRAAERGLVNAERPDSQDICFVPDGDYLSFLQTVRGLHCASGKFLDENGNVLGEHRGVAAYTIGQRKGLGIAFGEPRFVVSKNAADNTVTLGSNAALFSKELTAKDANWIAIPDLTEPLRVTARTRYRQKEAAATVEPLSDGCFRVLFDEPQRALTPGQAVVLYQEDVVIGGGTII